MKVKQQIINKQELDELIAIKIIKLYEYKGKKGIPENKSKGKTGKRNEGEPRKEKRERKIKLEKTQKKVFSREKRI